MRKIILLLFVLLAVFVIWKRQSLFVRDPLAKVVRDGIVESDAQVYINFSSDVMVENDNKPIYVQMVEHEGRTGAPTKLHCIHYVVCLTDADVPALDPWPGGIHVQQMSGQEVKFLDGKRQTSVVLY